MNCACLTFEITSLHTVIENWHLVQWLCGLECVYKTQYTFRIGPLKKSRRNQTNKLTNRDELSVIEWKQSLLSLLPTRIQSIIIIITAATAVAIVAIVAIATITTSNLHHHHQTLFRIEWTNLAIMFLLCRWISVDTTVLTSIWNSYGFILSISHSISLLLTKFSIFLLFFSFFCCIYHTFTLRNIQMVFDLVKGFRFIYIKRWRKKIANKKNWK